MAKNQKTVDLKVKGTDEFSGTFKRLADAQRRIIKNNKELDAMPRRDRLEYHRELIKYYRDVEQQSGEAQVAIAALSRQINDLATSGQGTASQLRKLEREKAKLISTTGALKTQYANVRQETARLNRTNDGSFQSFVRSEQAIRNQEATLARAARASQTKAAIQERLNSTTRSGFAAWSQYADTVARINAAEARSAEVTARKAAIQERLNGSVRSGFAAWSQYAGKMGSVTKAAQVAGSEAVQLANAQTRVNEAARGGFGAWSRTVLGMKQANAQADKLADTLQRVDKGRSGSKSVASGGQKGAAQDVEMYGLRPYQMVNLGYQFNDVISGLAMGQAPMQIFAQQAGQVAQIWPNTMVALVRSIPQLALLSAAFAPFIAAIVQTRKEAATLKEVEKNLAFLSDGSNYSAKNLTDIITGLDDLGVKAEDARAAVLSLVKQRLTEFEIKGVSETARRLSEFTGEDFASEVKRVAEAFGGGAEGVRDLDRELQFLTADQLKHIYELQRQGKETEAAAVAQDALNEKLRDAKAELTPMESATKSLSSAWGTFVDLVANSGEFQRFLEDLAELAEEIDGIAKGLERASKWVDRKLSPTPADRASNIQSQLDMAESWQSGRGQLPPGFTEPYVAKLRADLADALAEQEALTEATRETEAANKANVEAARSEEEVKLALDVNEAITARLGEMAREQEQVYQTAREQAIQKALIDAKNEAIEKGASLTKEGTALTREQTAALREQAGALFDAQNSAVGSGNYGPVVDRIIGVESGGRADAKNPNSSATGLGQFIESTWVSMFERYFPDRAAGMTDRAMALLRNDAALSRQMVELYARENAAALQKAGEVATDANVYLSHFLGPAGALATLKAPANATTDTFLGSDQIAANRSVLQGKTAQDVLKWAQMKMAVTDQELSAQQRIAEIERDRAKEVRSYNDSYEARLAQQKFELELAQKTAREQAVQTALRKEELAAQQAGLSLTPEQRSAVAAGAGAEFDQAAAADRQKELAEYNKGYKERAAAAQFELSLSQKTARQQAIQTALRKEELEAQAAGLELTEQQRAAIAGLAAQTFDRANAEAEVTRLVERRALLAESLDIAKNAGDTSKAQGLVDEIGGVEQELLKAIDAAIRFYQEMGGPNADQAILALENLKGSVGEVTGQMGTEFLPTAQNLNESLADIGGDSFSAFAQALGTSESAAKALFQTLRQGIASFLIDIGAAIVKQALFNAISGGTGGGGGFGQMVSSALTTSVVGVHHNGHTVDNPSTTRMVNPNVFANAMRSSKLRRGEVPIIAEDTEEVITADDPRHIKNGGGMQRSSASPVKIVNVMDPNDMLEAALATEPGERVLINYLSRNSNAVKGVLSK